MSKFLHRRLSQALLAGVALASLAAGGAQARVGVTSQTTNNPLGTPPQQQQRTLKVGIDVFANERVQTAANDRAHLLFLDGSSLTVGPNSDLLIDKFVYDPNSGTGELAISATKGIFRLVGGKITKTNEATIKVGTSTIGIRGGITIVNAPDCPPGAASADCQAQAYFMFGQQLTVTTPGGSETAQRPGSVINFAGNGPPSPPQVVPPNALAGPIGQLEAPAGTGNTGPAGTGIERQTAGSGLPPNNSGTPPNPGVPGQIAQTASNVTGAGSALGSGPDPNTPPQNTPGSTEPPPPPPPPPTTTISAEGRFVRQSEFTSATFSAFSVEAPRDPANNAYLASASVTDGRLTATSVNGYSANLPWLPGNEFNITDGVASDGGATLTGRGFVTSDEQYFYFYRVREATEGGRRNIIFGGVQTPTNEMLSGGFRAYDVSTLDPSEAPFLSQNATAIPVVSSATQGNLFVAHAPLAPAPGSDARTTWFQATLNIQGQGEAQSSYLSIATGAYGLDETKGGTPYAAGAQQAFIRESAFGGSSKYSTDVATAETQNGSAIYGPGGAYMVLVPERVTNNGESTTRTPSVGAALPFDTLEVTDIHYPVLRAGAINPPADLGTVRTGEILSGFSGALIENNNEGGMSSYAVYNTDPGQVTIVKNPTTNRVVGTFNLTTGAGGDNIQLSWGSLMDDAGVQQSAFIDDKRFAMRQSVSAPTTYNGDAVVAQMSMVTASAVALPTDILPAGVTFCDCQYLTWGYWQGDLNYTTGPRAGQRDYVTLGTWVTGKLAAEVDLPLSGSATYTGHIIGNVENDMGNSYVAVGGFSNTWDFGSRSGNVAITNFDGANYTGTTSGSPGSVNFNGSFSGVGAAANRSGQLWGAHYNAPGAGGNAAYQAGSFRLNSSDSNYKAAGTFAAQRGPIGPPVIVTIAP